MVKFKLFIDTNIIIDLLADRIPFSNAAYVIFREAKLKEWTLFTSSNSILTTFYILEKESSTKKANIAIGKLLNRIEVPDITKKGLLQALKSKTEDLEDASQIECANQIPKLDFIITRDKKGFKYSIDKVISSDEFVQVNGLC